MNLASHLTHPVFKRIGELADERGQRAFVIGGFVRDLLYRHVIRHWMNARVRRIRRGILPPVPGFDRPNHRHEETNRAA